jgi:hypothetical protein
VWPLIGKGFKENLERDDIYELPHCNSTGCAAAKLEM